MTRVIRKLHIYAGLLTFAHLIIYGIAGLASLTHTGAERPKVPHATRYIPFAIPPSATDKQVAALVHDNLKLPLTRPIPDWFLRRTPENHLLLDFYNINGIYRVVVLENEGRLRMEEIRNSTPTFLSDIHAATMGDRQAPSVVRAWAIWNEVAMWSLLGFCVSGAYLWLATRPRYIWAWVSFIIGSIAIGALWVVFRQ